MCKTATVTDKAMATVPTQQKEHKESIWKQLLHIDEVAAAIYLLTAKPIKSNLDMNLEPCSSLVDEDLVFCDMILGSVARPYAAAIRQLPREVSVNVMILHHALRALDTIEDDMTTFASNEIKVEYLNTFVGTALKDPNWNMEGVGEGDEALLLEEFPKCHRVFRSLDPAAQTIIKDITHRMALGMGEFILARNFQGPADIKEYNQYCHWVAGLVAEGLCRLFALGGLEQPSFAKELKLADNIGFFLQKCNIIRDFLEDYHDGRVFWPKSVWCNYTPSLSCFVTSAENSKARQQAVQCLNELVANALQEVPHVLTFLSKMRCVESYRFFAVLQLGALATLQKCYNNPNLFTGKVRIRKGLACKLALAGHRPDTVQEFFWIFATQIKQTAQSLGAKDPTFEQTVEICDKIIKITEPARDRQRARRYFHWFWLIISLVPLLVLQKIDFFVDRQLYPFLQTTFNPLIVAAMFSIYLFWSYSQGDTAAGPQPLQMASSIAKSNGIDTKQSGFTYQPLIPERLD